MSKKFDCVKMKHEIQKNLYKKFGSSSLKDYFDKITKYARESKLLPQLKVTHKR